MDIHSTPWPRIKRVSIKIVVCVYGSSSTTAVMMMTWRQTHIMVK
jgi:uncharacterized protein (DUF2236 family)